MITRRHLVIAVLLTFCVTATLFMIQPTRSQSGVGEYNPWADYNEDGEINILDLVPGALAFSSSGDPTKNVNVTNLPLDENGNLLVKTIERAKALHTHSLDISVFDSGGPGVIVNNHGRPQHFFVFAFDPPGQSVNTTKSYVTFMAQSSTGGQPTLLISINGVDTYFYDIWIASSPPEYATIETNPDLLITGLNTLKFVIAEGLIYSLTIHIEYQSFE